MIKIASPHERKLLTWIFHPSITYACVCNFLIFCAFNPSLGRC
ncbi:hypothetical protein GCWU000325_01293 [Alloprevotella tannerae ATCC 51259]|uniref:Uncharacterized protein n=1 Tax=Alloprevotella tannerae ATCC 51259 TaxID=626522 RepID=C9LGF1_9BACT|nr:hypothetical protein GCWU000325_01293 [Alloprevotella tannerae ATCC 51259]